MLLSELEALSDVTPSESGIVGFSMSTWSQFTFILATASFNGVLLSVTYTLYGDNRENVILAVYILFLATVAFVPICHFLGSSHLLGAFLAGLCFCTDHTIHHVWHHQIKHVLQWMLRIFFSATIGFAIPTRYFTAQAVIIRRLIYCICVMGKIVTGFYARPLNAKEFSIVGFSMSAWGKFSFILATATYSAVLLAVLLPVIYSPYALSFTISYFEKKAQKRMDNNIRQYEDTNLHPVYFAINTKARDQWGHEDKLLHQIFHLGFEIVDFRSWHAPEYNTSHTEPLTKESFYVMDSKLALPPTKHLDTHEKQQLKDRVRSIRNDLREALGGRAVINIKRWLPSVTKSDDYVNVSGDDSGSLCYDAYGVLVDEVSHGDDHGNHLYFAMSFVASLLVGEIVFGIIMGPHLLNLAGDEGSNFLIVIGEIGLVMLVVEAGIDVDVGMLKLIGTRGVALAVMCSVLPMTFGFCISFLFMGTDMTTSIAIGAMFGATSTETSGGKFAPKHKKTAAFKQAHNTNTLEDLARRSKASLHSMYSMRSMSDLDRKNTMEKLSKIVSLTNILDACGVAFQFYISYLLMGISYSDGCDAFNHLYFILSLAALLYCAGKDALLGGIIIGIKLIHLAGDEGSGLVMIVIKAGDVIALNVLSNVKLLNTPTRQLITKIKLDAMQVSILHLPWLNTLGLVIVYKKHIINNRTNCNTKICLYVNRELNVYFVMTMVRIYCLSMWYCYLVNIACVATVLSFKIDQQIRNVMIQLYIKELHGKTTLIELYDNVSVKALTEMIQDRTGIPYWLQRIIFCGKQLSRAGLLSEYNIGNGDTLELYVDMNGSNKYTLTNLKDTFGQTRIPYTGGEIENDGNYVQFEPRTQQCLIILSKWAKNGESRVAAAKIYKVYRNTPELFNILKLEPENFFRRYIQEYDDRTHRKNKKEGQRGRPHKVLAMSLSLLKELNVERSSTFIRTNFITWDNNADANIESQAYKSMAKHAKKYKKQNSESKMKKMIKKAMKKKEKKQQPKIHAKETYKSVKSILIKQMIKPDSIEALAMQIQNMSISVSSDTVCDVEMTDNTNNNNTMTVNDENINTNVKNGLANNGLIQKRNKKQLKRNLDGDEADDVISTSDIYYIFNTAKDVEAVAKELKSLAQQSWSHKNKIIEVLVLLVWKMKYDYDQLNGVPDKKDRLTIE